VEKAPTYFYLFLYNLLFLLTLVPGWDLASVSHFFAPQLYGSPELGVPPPSCIGELAGA